MSPAKRSFVPGSVAVAFALIAAPAQATLIGDTVSVEYHFPNLGTIFEEHLTVVQAGAADTVSFFTGSPQVTVNVEESSIQIDWISTMFQPGNFNGIVITDMDWVGQPASIVGLDIVTNFQGWNDAFASFTDDSIALNYATLGLVPAFSMTVNLLVRPDVPEPATLGLMALGLAAVGFGQRRRYRLTTHDAMRVQASRRAES